MSAEIVFVREPLAGPPSLTSEWIRSYSATAEITAPGDDQPTASNRVTTNNAAAYKAMRDSLRDTSGRAFHVSNVITGLSLMVAVGIAEKGSDLIPTAKLRAGKVRSLTFANANNTGDGCYARNANSFFLVSTTNETAGRMVSAQSKLVDSIIRERSLAEIDAENIALANAATSDALTLIQNSRLNVLPRVMFSEDGVLALQWQRGEYGVALIFAGNGVASVSFHRPGQFYAENGIEVGISEGLPNQVVHALAQVVG
jgi:hypothetical protein